MNQAVENAMRRNIITCPPVDMKKAPAKKSNVLNVAAPEQQAASSSSSDNAQENQLRKSGENIGNLVKIERLKDLLERINHQKKLLLREIEKSEDVPGPDLEKMMKCLEKLEREKAALDSQPTDDASKKKENEQLQARERKVEEREKRLEDKIRELYKSQKEVENSVPESVTSSEDAVAVPPVEIIIKVQGKSPRRVKVRKSIRCLDTLSREPGKVYPRTPKKKKAVQAEPEEKIAEKPVQVQQQTQTTPSISEVPKPILKKSQDSQQANTRRSEESSQSISTSYQSLPDRINVSQLVEDARKPHHKLNPALMHYITRLLGMSKTIGNQLSVSSSTVTTPGTSTINTSGNAGSVDYQQPSFDEERLKRLQEFINNNYSFLSEINDTLDRSQIQEIDDESVSKVDGIWRDVLRQKKPDAGSVKKVEAKSVPVSSVASKKSQQSIATKQSSAKILMPPPRPPQPARQQQPPQPARQQQPPKRPATARVANQLPVATAKVIKQPPPSQRPQTARAASQPQRPQITNRDMMNVTKYLESHMLNNYTEYTANCQKRIADLAQMMEKVRQEKLKLIENSLSSGEFGHFTEYKEIAMPGKTQDAPATSASDIKDSPSQREDPPSEEINNILQTQTRPFGVSKDSGISMLSRPVTSSDFRDSPDARVTSEERENTFQPILKDIPKPPRVRVSPADGGSTETINNLSALIKDQDDKAQKKLKPPLSLNRYSPRLEPHELSTIVEVETPSASKANLQENLEDIGIKSFPNFEEYTKNIQSSSVNKSREASSGFLQLDDLKTALDNLKITSFVESQDLPEITQEDDPPSNGSSIVDIVEELKRRNIINKPFDEVQDEHTTPTANRQLVAPKSPTRKPAQSRIVIRTPPNAQIEIQREMARTPTKKRPVVESHPPPESPTSNDTLSGIQEIEKEPKDDIGKDLQDMGINWAASMLKRDGESKQLESSSSSTSVEKGKTIEIDIDTRTSTAHQSSTTSSSTPAKQPLNLRSFLASELARRSQANKSLSSESSLSSEFMRSLLNATSGNSSSGSRQSSDHDRMRTSTPVNTRGSSQLMSQLKTGHSQQFLGDSLSTVKGSEASGSDKSNDKRRSN